ncbi:hypothetical protein EJ05DRAFT_92671 [Pseudovirgaria hyperparasitica]|uniref:Camp independent regulatory protein n=1 Tax=Pseudovirgaria hyperparasitica TaxID=470096 RepID=A0A6A6W236_9PEZI|nr:uncharacterized protein EJ05DRAFT_92671 [Pseudovirgaria hyperparasitica]KAF2756179.1 hypothetical protein EJ05DRAFT_92671 [Pseudovirgaria hyperparasitica]
MDSSNMYSQPRPAKRMAYEDIRCNGFSSPASSVISNEPWLSAVDTAGSPYEPIPRVSYMNSPSRYHDGVDAKTELLPSTPGLHMPANAYVTSHPSANPAPLNPRMDSAHPSNNQAIQPRVEPLPRQATLPPTPSPSRSTLRTKSRGTRSAEQKLEPTWKGFIGSTYEALQLLEGCLQGKLRHMPRRAYDREREDVIRSGHVFVFEENASGIKRWTDGVSWSPSRLLPNFLIYREVEEKDHKPGEKKKAIKKRKRSDDDGVDEYDEVSGDQAAPVLNPNDIALTIPEPERRRLCGSLTDSYNFKSDGLVKKTISVEYKGNVHHIIAYYKLEDVLFGKLARMSEDAKFGEIQPRFDLLNMQKFQNNPDNPMDDPIRFQHHMRHADMQAHHWPQYSPSHQSMQPLQAPPPLHYYPVGQTPVAQDGFWTPTGGHWSQQTPMIQTFTPMATGSPFGGARADIGSHNGGGLTPLSYSAGHMSQYQPAFSQMMAGNYSDGYLPS